MEPDIRIELVRLHNRVEEMAQMLERLDRFIRSECEHAQCEMCSDEVVRCVDCGKRTCTHNWELIFNEGYTKTKCSICGAVAAIQPVDQ